jgi:hypothetical protein
MEYDRMVNKGKGKAAPVTGPWRPIGLWGVEAPTFF